MKRIYEDSKKNAPVIWDDLIGFLDTYKYRINYEKDSEFYEDLAIIEIGGIGKETGDIPIWIETLKWLDTVMNKSFKPRGFTWKVVNHGLGFRLDVYPPKIKKY